MAKLEPEFPQAQIAGANVSVDLAEWGGMTLRDYFAAAVLPAIYAHSVRVGNDSQDAIVSEAYELADSMLEARVPKTDKATS